MGTILIIFTRVYCIFYSKRRNEKERQRETKGQRDIERYRVKKRDRDWHRELFLKFDFIY